MIRNGKWVEEKPMAEDKKFIIFRCEDGSEWGVKERLWLKAEKNPKMIAGHEWECVKPKPEKPLMQMIAECKDFYVVTKN